MLENNPKPNDIYRHFKGSLYKIITLAIHSESGEQMVVYQALYGGYQVYVRPLSMFVEKVDRKKYPDAAQEYRFEKMSQFIDAGVRPGTEAARPEASYYNTDKTLQEPPEDENEKISPEEEPQIDRVLMQFLEADTYEDKLSILGLLHPRITDDMINTMAVAIDVEVEEGDIETRYQGLKSCLVMLEKFECSRIR